MKLLQLILCLLLPFAGFGSGKYHFDYTDNCANAYVQYLSLQPEEGYKHIKKEILDDPHNLMATYIADYDDCLTLLFNGNPLDYEQRKHHFNERLKLLSKGDENSPWYRLCKAGLYMHWAFVYIKFNERIKAASAFRKSYILLKENKQLFPDFKYNDIFFGIEEAAVGAIPDNYKWVASIFGMKGDILEGTKKVERFIKDKDEGAPFYKEAVVYITYIHYFLMSDKEKAWSIVKDPSFVEKDDLLYSFLKANIALNYRKADEAKATLERAMTFKGYKAYPILDYEYGYALLHKLDNRSIAVFKDFLKRDKGGLFVKDALQKIAYGFYLAGDMDKATAYKNKISQQGSTLTDADRQALRFSENGSWPNAILLKAQLLTDGGYYTRAQRLLADKNLNDFTEVGEQLEYLFRLARIYDEQGQKKEAVTYYSQVIKKGRDRKEQFAARSALQLGFLYEHQRNNTKAIEMYQDALSMGDHDFKNSIDQQAKAGILRLQSNQ